MRQQLLSGPESGAAESARGGSRHGLQGLGQLRLRGGEDSPVAFCGGLFAVCLLIGFFFISPLHPNEYGITRNLLTGQVSSEVYRGGIHFTGPFKQFVTFPASQKTLLFADGVHASRPPVQTRTGADRGSSGMGGDADSGGQPIIISCALQYQYIQDLVPKVYLDFGSFAASEQRYILLASNMVSNIAQEFTPQDFWSNRRQISDRMLMQIKDILKDDGKVNATRFEILKVDFATKFEDAITAVQVAEQQKVVNEYDQQVQRVVQSIEVLRAQNTARIAAIDSQAEAVAKAQIANATRDGFNMKQGMKATKYAELKRALELNESSMAEYFKIKSIQGQEGKPGRVVVGVPSVGRTEL